MVISLLPSEVKRVMTRNLSEICEAIDGARPGAQDEINSPLDGLCQLRPEGFYVGERFEEVEDGEENETVPDTVEHPDDRNTREDKEKTEAGEAETDQAADE
ncbi:hypothetical protein [Brevibacterium sediminis]|uniref:hypothetical protein n=1 Tax=Brevibacterium sediminis TaxID=1857024 RepID=UPI00366F55F0